MVRSDYCSTNLKKDRPNTECRFDPGCFFIVKGSEKVVIGLERICTNKMLCFTKKDPNFPDGIMYTCQVNSQNINYDNIDGSSSNVQIASVRMKRDNSIILNMTQFADIPIFIIFRALGITTDNDIINYIISDPSDTEMLNILKISLNKALSENIKNEEDNYREIKTQDDAYQYLMFKLKNKRYSTTNIETNNHQRRKHLELLLSRDFLPHMGKTVDKITYKAYYLGKMINKLLNTFLGRIEIDDRDSFINKRIDLPGALMGQLFRQYFKKMLNDCGKYFKKKNNGNHTNPIDVIKFIKFTTIEQGLLKALLTGTWGTSKRKGIAQMLPRLTYKQFVSYFRRIMPPPLDASNSKVTSMRHVNNIQYGFVDIIETPDGHKIGLHKHLALMCSITINMNIAHINNIKTILQTLKNPLTGQNFITDLTNIPLYLINKKVHINLNGEWLGICDNSFELVEQLKEKRRIGEINIQASINFNIRTKTIDIYTDAGRMIRPLLRVVNNKLLLTKDMLNNIDSSYNDKNKITRWGEFIQRYQEVIEYVDVEESENLMIAMYPHEIKEARDKMLNDDPPSKGGRGNPINRYDKVYVKYTHCEFHPMMFMGIISANIPFSEHNQAPRNYFNFAQTRQGMGIYASNHRYRVDLSYLLYHPMKPLVITRAAKYTHELDIPAGEMMIVAIACYTGYNQEDSIVMNRSSMQRGMCVSTTLKKYNNTITKNTSTGQDDVFMKPDRNKVTGMMDLNFYNKLNDKGYVPEETVITNGDVIIGKVSPIQASSSTNKLYKDESDTYKSTVAATVDKVYTGIYNSDGYEMYNMRIRSERTPMIGDKMCCYDDTHEILTQNGWINIKNITINDRVACLYDENTLEYEYPTELMTYDYEGPMYCVETTQINLCVTPNHDMWVREENTHYKKEQSQNIFGKRKYYKKNIDNIKVNKNNNYFVYDELDQITHFKINNMKYQIEEWLETFGSYIAQSKNQLPKWIWYLPPSLCRILIKTIISKAINDNETEIYNTSYKILADDFQRLCLHAGWACNIVSEYNDETLDTNLYSMIVIKTDIEPVINNPIQKCNQGDKYVEFKGKVYCCSVPYLGVLYVRRNGVPIFCGNSRHGQKGTLGILLPCTDMPFTESGIQPDIIINPCCIPSRMTIGQLFESVFSKVAALRGEIIDATPFNNFDFTKITDELKEYGFDENGYEYLYCGMTGKKILSKIFIGPTFYLRLKHMVQDKIHCLTLDHEVNTTNGWKPYSKLDDTDIILTYNINKNEIEYYNYSSSVMYSSYNGEMYEIPKIGQKVTHNHKMLVTIDKINYQLVKIQDIIYPIYFKTDIDDILIEKQDVIKSIVSGMHVFCLTVPNETFMVKRNNLISWTGNSRATGPRQKLTWQPPEGRARDGGLRFGEMERDAMISHGCSLFLKERLVDTSDIYTCYVCNKCGLIASKQMNKDIYVCHSCNKLPENQGEIVYANKIQIPYAFKLLVNELMAINILPRIRVKNDNYTNNA